MNMNDLTHAARLLAGSSFDPLRRFVQLEKERRQLEDRAKAIRDECAHLEETLLNEWADRGQRNANVDGLTVYIANDFYCNKKGGIETEAICQALIRHGLGHLVSPNYSASSLKAWVKEQASIGSDLPEDLREMLSYDSVYRLRTRLSAT